MLSLHKCMSIRFNKLSSILCIESKKSSSALMSAQFTVIFMIYFDILQQLNIWQDCMSAPHQTFPISYATLPHSIFQLVLSRYKFIQFYCDRFISIIRNLLYCAPIKIICSYKQVRFIGQLMKEYKPIIMCKYIHVNLL